MGYTIEFADEAYQRLDDILAYMQEVLFNPIAAQSFYQKLRERIAQLEDSPRMYAAVKNPFWAQLDYHKLSVNRYIVVYRIYEESRTVRIMGIFSELEDYEHKL